MHSIHSPLAGYLERMAEVEQEIFRRHSSASEEVLAHPVVITRGLEVVRQTFVQENVNKEESALLQPSVDVGHQLFIVLHVLEHLNANHLHQTI
jgi:hypothetical protein